MRVRESLGHRQTANSGITDTGWGRKVLAHRHLPGPQEASGLRTRAGVERPWLIDTCLDHCTGIVGAGGVRTRAVIESLWLIDTVLDPRKPADCGHGLRSRGLGS